MKPFGIMEGGSEIWEHLGMLYSRRSEISRSNRGIRFPDPDFENTFAWKVARFVKLPNSNIVTKEYLEEERNKTNGRGFNNI